jgi:hypothetical protein
MATAIPDTYSLKSSCKIVYDQGQTSACVAYSIAGMQSGFEVLDEGEVITFDAARIYKDNGGTGNNGIFADDVLAYAVKQGLPEIDSTDRRKLASYAYTTDIATIISAIAVNRFVVMALLLPTDFLQGVCGQGSVTNAYHQILCCGYNKATGRLEFLNSWGKGYGQNGFGTILMSYLQSPEQSRYFYAYSAVDVLDTPQPIPIPTPVPVPIPIPPTPTPIPTPTPNRLRVTLRPTIVKRSILMGGGASLVVEVTKYGTSMGIANVPVNLTVNGKNLGTKTSKTAFVNWVISKADFHGTATLTVDDPSYMKTVRMVTLA